MNEDIKNKKLFQQLQNKNFLHPNPFNDGAWGWTKKGKNEIKSIIRYALSDSLYDTILFDTQKELLKEFFKNNNIT